MSDELRITRELVEKLRGWAREGGRAERTMIDAYLNGVAAGFPDGIQRGGAVRGPDKVGAAR